ncbi:MAG: glycoside hydrolase family 2 TIM barrel-domain containing protein [Thermoguttaceae bacterium]
MKKTISFFRLVVSPCAALMLAACAVSSRSEASTPVLALAASPDGAGRDLLFTEGWKFFRGDGAGAQDPAFHDSTWRTLDLPHDWSVEGSFDPNLASCTAFLPCGTSWYRKTFTVGAEAKDKSISIRFDGIVNHSTVWCNGRQVGGRPYGYSSFTCDLTPAIHFGENVIAVRVNHEQYGDSRWYAGSGIYRNVFLSMTGKVHVDTNGTFVTTPKVTADSADVDVQTIVKNDDVAPVDVTVVTSFKNDQGRRIASHEQTAFVPAGGRKQFAAIAKVARPALWSPDHPNMYGIQTQVKKGERTVDQYSTPFGIRKFAFDPAKGFSINGQGMKLKGVCLHHDAGALGGAVPIQVWQRRLKLLQDAGCNAIRCSHNPPAPEFLDLCDRMGLLVMDEAFDEWTRGKKKWLVGHNVGQPGTDGYHSDFDKWADIDVRDMVVRDRNHPSIILWSIGNEIDYRNDPYPPHSPELPPIAERLIKDVKAFDTTRPVTAACASPATNLFKKLLDVEGYNYMERLYPGDHAANPARVIYGSENSHALSAWQAVAQNDYIAGQFLWTGIDYLGEAGVWPSHASGAGLLNLAGLPKDQYYFRKSLWTDAPMVYLSTSGPGWRGRARGGPMAKVVSCYTNCDRVELFHDGRSLGSKPQTAQRVITWPLDFTSGALKAVGTQGGKQVTFELKKASIAARVMLRPDVKRLVANGRDVAQIEVNVTDKDGALAPDAGNLIACAVSGPARIIGIENGNTSSTEDYKVMSRSVYQGRMMIYVQSLKTAGDAKLSVSAPSLEGSSITLPVQ